MATQSYWGAFRPTWGFSARLPLVVAAVMSVKWNTFCKKINKERLEMEIRSPWKLGRWGDAWLVLRGARPTRLSCWGGGGGGCLSESRKLGAGAVESEVIIKHMRWCCQ